MRLHLFSSDAKTKDLKVGAKLKIEVFKALPEGGREELGEWEVTLTSVEVVREQYVINFGYQGSTYKALWQPRRWGLRTFPGFLASKDGKPLGD